MSTRPGGPHGHHAPHEPRPTPWPLRQAWPVQSTGGPTAFVLTGCAAACGAVQVGMMAALHEQGIDPDLLVGTSVGSCATPRTSPGRVTTGHRLAVSPTCGSGMRRRRRVRRRPGRWLRAVVGGLGVILLRRPVAASPDGTTCGYHAFEEARLAAVRDAQPTSSPAPPCILTVARSSTAVAASAAVPGLPAAADAGSSPPLVDGAVGHAVTLAHADARESTTSTCCPRGTRAPGHRRTASLGRRR